jgi:hypothetical protein
VFGSAGLKIADTFGRKQRLFPAFFDLKTPLTGLETTFFSANNPDGIFLTKSLFFQL